MLECLLVEKKLNLAHLFAISSRAAMSGMQPHAGKLQVWQLASSALAEFFRALIEQETKPVRQDSLWLESLD